MQQNKANPSDSRSNTEKKQRRLANLKPFGPGPDPRRNLKGRPRTFDEVREVALAIANETESNRKTAIENVLRSWRDSPEPTLQKAFVEYGYGKVPDKLETILDDKRTLKLHWPHERQDLTTSQNGNENGSR